jgi:uncharacterized protein (DUF58 family)
LLTRSGWLVIVGGVLTLVAGRVLGLPELYVLGATALALALVAVVQVRRRPPDVDVARTIHPPRVPLGGEGHVELRIANRGLRAAPVLSLHDPVAGTVGATVSLAPLAPGEQQAASYRLPTGRRGLVRVGPLEARLVDPFGLARRRTEVAGEAALTVLPAIDELRRPVKGGGFDDPLGGIAHRVPGSAGDEDFATLRPYVVGDDLRRVHWSSSARAGDLLVRQDDPPWQGQLTVVLDARADRLDPERFEVAVSAAASLVHAVAQRGDRVRLVLSDGTDTGMVDARAGRDTLLEHLALVERHDATALPEPASDGRGRAGGLVVVAGAPDADDLALLAAQRSRYGAVRLVAVLGHDAPGAGAGAGGPLSRPVPPGVELVALRPGTEFADAWQATSPTAVAR